MAEQSGSAWTRPARALVVLALTASLGLAVWRGELPVARAATQLVLGMATVGFLVGFTREIERGEWPRIETSWGGLGGGLGGWRMSPALACLLGALVFGGVFAASATGPAPEVPEAAR